MSLKNFEIKKEFLTSVIEYDEMKLTNITPLGIMTDEQRQFMEDICDKPFKVTRTVDHPEFTKLREQLGATGYIEIERSWWNGDRVLKAFKLNNHFFQKGSTFFCASALGTMVGLDKEG